MTTVLAVSHKGRIAFGGDGQVTVGDHTVKHKAVKIRRLFDNKVVVGFAGGAADALALNDIARIRLRLAEPLLVDPYAENRTTGSFVLVDEATKETVAAGMVVAATA